jgi:ActR/RegA family two-component response regulator
MRGCAFGKPFAAQVHLKESTMENRDEHKRPVRLLFVDDEPNIRLTMPQILKMRGYQVTVAATVPEALAEIGKNNFDVLLSDLNIGHPADGFTVVSAMRRTQPDCINLILTGYPAFETALEAIRNHVDDYLTKPADIEYIFGVIEAKLQNPQPRRPLATRKLTSILRDNSDAVLTHFLREMKSHSELAQIQLSDEERVNNYGQLLRLLVDSLALGFDKPDQAMLEAAANHGKTRKQHGYSAPMIVEDVRCLRAAINRVIQENLLALDASELLPDLNRIYDILQLQLKESISAFLRNGSAKPGSKTRKGVSNIA